MPRRPPVFNPRRGHALQPEQRLSPTARGYTSSWDRESKAYRRLHPLCEYCLASAFGPKRVEPCTRVDHLYPQRQFEGVFWSVCWWVSSCDACDGVKQALEHGPKAGLDQLARLLGRPVLTRPDLA